MSELEKTIEELEAEVLAELEEASQPDDSGGKADAPAKVKKNAEDGSEESLNNASPEGKVMPIEKAVNDPDDSLGAKASKSTKEVGGDEQQKSEGKPQKMVKGQGKPDGTPTSNKSQAMAAGYEPEGDEVLGEAKMTKAQALEQIGKMKKSDIEEMMAAHASKLAEADNAKSEEELAKLQAEKEAIEEKIKSINVKEDVDALVAGEDLSEEFKDKAATIFEAAVKSKIRSEVVRMEEGYAVALEEATETIKEELSEKVDDYLGYVVEEWMKENELAIERGLKGEIAEDFISGLKQLFEDHYIDVPDEKYDVLEAQSEKIAELEEKLNGMIEENVEKKKVVESLTREQITSEVSYDLAATEVEKFKSLTEDVDFVTEDSFRAKLDTLKESYFPTTGEKQSFVIDDDGSEPAQDIDTTESIKAYMSAISRSKSA
jgi:hypothetical protein